jgi:hypothetical protein
MQDYLLCDDITYHAHVSWLGPTKLQGTSSEVSIMTESWWGQWIHTHIVHTQQSQVAKQSVGIHRMVEQVSNSSLVGRRNRGRICAQIRIFCIYVVVVLIWVEEDY